MSIFTEYVRSLDSREEPPTVEEIGCLLAELRKVLAGELRRRNLWSQPPSYLGIYGTQSWTEPYTDQGDALDELTEECYVFVFLDTLRSLRAHARTKPDIDGLVVLHVRNFLHGLQKKNDPLGFKVYDVLRAALLHLVEQGSLHVLRGSRKVRNDTVFGFGTLENPERPGDPYSDSDVGSWSDEIVPALLGARGETSAEAVSRLVERIAELPEHGARVFRFRELVNPLKDDVRARWSKLLEELQGELAPDVDGDDETGERIVRLIAVTQPENAFEQREWFERIVDCVDQGLRGLDVRAKAREYLKRLWSFLRGYALDAGSEKLPSQRQLSELLDIPRERFSELYEILGSLLEQCRVRESGMLRATVGGGARSMDLQTRREDLQRRTAEALARLAEEETPSGGVPSAGDLYVLERAGDRPLEWAVLYRAAGRCLVVPADSFPLTGSADVAVDRGLASGPLRLRCTFAVWIDAADLDARERSGFVEPSVVEKARTKVAAVEDGAVSALPSELEADRDPEYEDWIDEIVAPGRDALAKARTPARTPAPRRPVVLPYSLAAALFAAVVGLTFYSTALRKQVAVERGPIPVTLDIDQRREVVFPESPRAAESTLVIAPGSTHFLLPLVLLSDKLPAQEGYVVEIVDADGKTVWKSDVFAPREEYTLLVPRNRLPAGSYCFRLYGVTAGADVLLDEQKRRIEYREEP